MHHTTCTTTLAKHLVSCLQDSDENGGGGGGGGGGNDIEMWWCGANELRCYTIHKWFSQKILYR